MAFTATMSTANPGYSLGPEKVQFFTWTAAGSDTSGTITLDRLSNVRRVVLSGGIGLSAATTYSGNVATVAFTNNTPVVFTCSCASASATAGGVYADTSGNLFSVAATIAGATAITLNGFKPPASATITKTGAIAGDATIGTLVVTSATSLFGDGVAYGT